MICLSQIDFIVKNLTIKSMRSQELCTRFGKKGKIKAKFAVLTDNDLLCLLKEWK
jgi:hypothetical protein